MLIRRVIQEGEMLPEWYYGIAYFDHVSRVAIFYPVPINLLVGWWRRLGFWWNDVRSGHINRSDIIVMTGSELSQIRKESYGRGKKDGQQERDREILQSLIDFNAMENVDNADRY